MIFPYPGASETHIILKGLYDDQGLFMWFLENVKEFSAGNFHFVHCLINLRIEVTVTDKRYDTNDQILLLK